MREIKFMAYHRAKKWTCSVESLHLMENYPFVIVGGNKYLLTDIELMQFTGLIDKNGVEIYEGDIIKWGHANEYSSENWHRVAEVQLFPSLRFKVLHYIDSKTLEQKTTDGYIFEFGRFGYRDTDKHLEVIGNIYENMELLND